MLAKEVEQLLSRLQTSVKQRVSLRCSCENLETVYIHLDDNGGVRVDDDHRTFQYLTEGNNSTYVPVETLDLASIRKRLAELQVELVDAPPDGYPSIECQIHPEQPIADAVHRVAQAVDRVFYMASHPEFQWLPPDPPL